MNKFTRKMMLAIACIIAGCIMFKRNTNCRIPDLREHGKKQLGEAFSANQQKMPPNIGILSGLLPEIYKV